MGPALELKAVFYIDRVATDANIADGPSRDRKRECEQAGWLPRKAVMPEVILKGLGWFQRKILELGSRFKGKLEGVKFK